MWAIPFLLAAISSVVAANPAITTTPTTTTTTTSMPTAAPPSPTQSGLSPKCKVFYDVNPGDTCFDISEQYGVPLNQFYKLNPSVGNECENLLAYNYVCVGTQGTATTITSEAPTPSPTQHGLIKKCTKFYKAVSADQCQNIEAKFEITPQQFSKWNPAVSQSCGNFIKNYYYCVSVS